MTDQPDPDVPRRILHGLTDEGFDLRDATVVDGEVIYPEPSSTQGEQYATVRVVIEYRVGLEVADRIAEGRTRPTD